MSTMIENLFKCEDPKCGIEELSNRLKFTTCSKCGGVSRRVLTPPRNKEEEGGGVSSSDIQETGGKIMRQLKIKEEDPKSEDSKDVSATSEETKEESKEDSPSLSNDDILGSEDFEDNDEQGYKCGGCGAEINPDMSVCPDCGNELIW